MHIRQALMGAVAALGALAAASAAEATVITLTFTGTVSSGSSDESVFGATMLDGDAFTAVYQLDDSIGTRATTATSDEVYGYPGSDPIIAATLTINGTTVDMLAASTGDVYTQGGDRVSAQLNGTTSIAFVVQYRTLNLVGLTAAAPVSLDTPFSGAVTGNGSFFYQDYAYNGFGGGSSVANATGTLAADYLTVSIPGGVPEPATWALLIAGFGGTGALLRRRRLAVI